jgi:hypothetical protein
VLHYVDTNVNRIDLVDRAPKQIVAGLITVNRKATTCFFGPIIKVCLQHWFPLLKEDTPIDSQNHNQFRKERRRLLRSNLKNPLLRLSLRSNSLMNVDWCIQLIYHHDQFDSHTS